MCWWVDEMLANGFNLRGRIVQHDREQGLAYNELMSNDEVVLG